MPYSVCRKNRWRRNCPSSSSSSSSSDCSSSSSSSDCSSSSSSCSTKKKYNKRKHVMKKLNSKTLLTWKAFSTTSSPITIPSSNDTPSFMANGNSLVASKFSSAIPVPLEMHLTSAVLFVQSGNNSVPAVSGFDVTAELHHVKGNEDRTVTTLTLTSGTTTSVSIPPAKVSTGDLLYVRVVSSSQRTLTNETVLSLSVGLE